MGQGKGSAIAITLLLCLFLIQSEMAQARVYTVGDAKGWTFNVNSWTKRKIFRAGDVLGKFLSFTPCTPLFYKMYVRLVFV